MAGEDQLFQRFGREFPKGHVLFREGESGSEMYVVQSGKVNITKRVRETEKRRDVRAALICLLTAFIVASDTACRVGDDTGGWFFLPPRAWWADWARNAPVNCAP